MWPPDAITAAAGVPRCGHCHQPLPWIADANDDTFAEIAEGASIPVVVDMWAAGRRGAGREPARPGREGPRKLPGLRMRPSGTRREAVIT
jgi:hypothetical protein